MAIPIRPKHVGLVLRADDVMESFRESFGEVTEARSVERAVASGTGVWSLDLALGGGLSPGIVEICGEESVGKTALLGSILSQCQADGHHAVLVGADYLDLPYLRNLGVDLDRLLVVPPDADLTHFLRGFLNCSGKKLVAVDSLTNLFDCATWLEDASGFLLLLRGSLDLESLVICTTQVRTKTSADPERTFVSGRTDSQARGLAHLFDTRLVLSRREVGEHRYVMGANIVRSGLGPSSKYLELPATKGYGIERHLDAVRVASSAGVLELRGPTVYFGDRPVGRGERGAAELLMRDRALMLEVLAKTLER